MNPTAVPVPFLRRRWVRWLLALLTLGILYTAGGFLLAPRIIRSQLLKRLTALTHRQADVGRVVVNPFRLTLTVSNLTLLEPDGSRFAAFERFHADLQAASLWRWALVLREVQLDRPFIAVVRQPDGSFNFDNLVPTNSAPATNPPPAAMIASVRVDGGELVFTDRAVAGGFTKKLGPASLFLTNFSTLPAALAQGTFQTSGDSGEEITWAGDLGVQPPASAGELRVERLALPRNGPYVRLATTAVVTDGAVRLAAQYRLSLSNGVLDVEVTNTAFGLTNLAMKLPTGSAPNFILTELAVSDVFASLRDRRIQVGKIAVHDGEFSAQRGSDGSVDVAQAIRPEFVEHAVVALEDLLKGLQIDVPLITGERLDLVWSDLGMKSPVRLLVTVERAEIKDLSNRTNQPVSLSAVAHWMTNGLVKVEADATLLPARASLRLEFDQLLLPPAQPYLDELVNLRLNRGAASGRLEFTYNRNPGGPLVTGEGEVTVKDFLAFDTLTARDFLKWDALELKKFQAAWEPATVRFAEIHLEAPATSFVLMTNGQFNVLSLLRTGDAPATTNAPVARAATNAPLPFALSVNVDRFTLNNASLYAADQTIPGEFSTTLQKFSGSVTDLAWPEMKKSRVELAGLVGAHAPFTVEGWALPDPHRMFLDMHVTATNAELIPFTPYTIKFVGYPLKGGRITADVRYRVDGRQLEGENKVLVDKLTLGPRAGGTPIFDLPIKLGIALLKDSNGRITLDVPVKGSLDDPEFGVGKVVWGAVKGLFVKVATAPFKLLGSLFGGSEDEGQELQFVEFEAGATNLPPAVTNRLERLTTALVKRPELLLALRGGALPQEDGPALARQNLDAALRQLRIAELTATGGAAPSVAELPLSPGERARLLVQLFTNSPPAVALPVSAAASDATPPTAPSTAPSAGEMERELLVRLRPKGADLELLRQARVVVVKEALLRDPRLTLERLVLPDAGDTNTPPLLQRGVEFSLE